MGRRTNRKELLDKIEMLRTEIPDIVLRTTLITGFPGETQEDFEEMLSFVDMVGFERLGVFPYSPEEGTPAAEMEDQIDEEVKKQRRDAIMELQQESAFEKAEDMKDRVLEVMIEGKVADENAFVGRTYKDAPNVDGLIFVNADAVHPGSAGEHEAVVGVEFAELASVQFHVQHDPLAHGLIQICPDEGETGLTAHAGGAFKSHIAAGTAAEVQGDPLGTEHVSGLLPAGLLRLSSSTPVKDPGEVHVEQHIGESRDLLLTTFSPAIPVELVHQLVEHGAAVLLVPGTRYLAVLGGTAVQSKDVNAVFLRGIAHHCPGREFVDLIGRHWLTSVCSILPQTISKSKRILLPLLLRWELFVFKFLKWRYQT